MWRRCFSSTHSFAFPPPSPGIFWPRLSSSDNNILFAPALFRKSNPFFEPDDLNCLKTIRISTGKIIQTAHSPGRSTGHGSVFGRSAFSLHRKIVFSVTSLQFIILKSNLDESLIKSHSRSIFKARLQLRSRFQVSLAATSGRQTKILGTGERPPFAKPRRTMHHLKGVVG